MKLHWSILLLAVSLGICRFAPAQVSGSLRSASDGASGCASPGSPSPGSDNSSSSSIFSDDTGSSSTNYAADTFPVDPPGFPFEKLQRRTLAKRPCLPRMNSFEINGTAGLNLQGYLMLPPEIKTNWGIFTLSFRHMNILEPQKEGEDHWRTLDIDFLQFNLVNRKHVRFRIGTGLSKETYKNKNFHEYISNLDLFLFKDKLLLTQEVRLSTNYCGCLPQRQEYNAGINLLVLDTPHFRIYNSYTYMTQLYYGLVGVTSVGGGFKLVIIP